MVNLYISLRNNITYANCYFDVSLLQLFIYLFILCVVYVLITPTQCIKLGHQQLLVSFVDFYYHFIINKISSNP